MMALCRRRLLSNLTSVQRKPCFPRSASASTSTRLAMYTGNWENYIYDQVNVVDLRSDTVTKPTPLMRQAMFEAAVGDDVYKEDPTVNALEEKAAALLGKEASLFVASGTMGNLIATMVHCDKRGSEMVVGDLSHMFKYEQGGSAQIAGVQICTLPNKSDGTFDLAELEAHIRGSNDHEPVTALVCVENTHNMCGGKAVPLHWLDKLAEVAKAHTIPLHLDGARLFNAAVHQQVSAAHLARHFQSVSFCLSKGLGAPVGSLLVGSSQFICRARRTRKALGGGMRQVGVLAAAGIVALDHMIERLSEDHSHAASIGKAIADTHNKYITVDIENVHTNILLVNVDPGQITAEKFCKRLAHVTKEEKEQLKDSVVIVKACPKNTVCVRLVTHADISPADVDATIKKIQFIIQECGSN